jgi:hypothetical protein
VEDAKSLFPGAAVSHVGSAGGVALIARVGDTRRDSRGFTGWSRSVIHLLQPSSRRSIALSVARDQSCAAWFAVSTLVMASVASSTLLYKTSPPAMFDHDRYGISLSGKSHKLQGVSLQGEVDSHTSDEDGGPLFARPIRTIRFVKPEAGEDTLIPTLKVSLGSPATTAEAAAGESTTKQPATRLGEVGQYLWEVYQRTPTKQDGSGDFTWKDPAAAERLGMSMPEYVIGGMDQDFREELYAAGRAMDAAGIKWAILSAFRDDYRQNLASGYRAGARNSLHGGSVRTGGYGHGRAVDVTGADDNAETVWKWIDAHGAKFGLRRPMPGTDPGHVQATGDWHTLAAALRQARIKSAQANGPINTAATRINLIASASR